jgi:hypothetical protein
MNKKPVFLIENKYVDLNFDMEIDTIDKIVYSKSNGEKIDIPLV